MSSDVPVWRGEVEGPSLMGAPKRLQFWLDCVDGALLVMTMFRVTNEGLKPAREVWELYRGSEVAGYADIELEGP